ncbi:hypothetical protein [Mesorhizobium sp. M0847]|uniref:hypothetical protein n=1 Tax=unclassified Mesorhizobium TaxID=325217 RepID=UPI00333739A1
MRVGVIRYPAGGRRADASEPMPDLVDACSNIRIGSPCAWQSPPGPHRALSNAG